MDFRLEKEYAKREILGSLVYQLCLSSVTLSLSLSQFQQEEVEMKLSNFNINPHEVEVINANEKAGTSGRTDVLRYL